jgi:hypothetical protein
MGGDAMKVRDILSERESQKGLASGTIGHVGGNDTNNLRSINRSRIEDRSSADAVDGHFINQVGVSVIFPSTDIAREKAEGRLCYGRKSEPTNFDSDGEPGFSWQQWYKLLWEFKVTHWHKNHC